MTISKHAEERLTYRRIKAEWAFAVVDSGVCRKAYGRCLMSMLNGLIVVFDPHNEKVVTAYWGTPSQLLEFYGREA